MGPDAATTARLLEALAASLTRQSNPDEVSLARLLDRITGENLHAEIESDPAIGNEAW